MELAGYFLSIIIYNSMAGDGNTWNQDSYIEKAGPCKQDTQLSRVEDSNFNLYFVDVRFWSGLYCGIQLESAKIKQALEPISVCF